MEILNIMVRTTISTNTLSMVALSIAIAMASVAVAGPVVTKNEIVFVPQDNMVDAKSLPETADTELSKSMKENIVNLDEKPVFKNQGPTRMVIRRKARLINDGLARNIADKNETAPPIRFEKLEKEKAKIELQRSQSKK